MSKTTLVVPTDFSSVANTALNHALYIAKPMDGKVVLLHILKSDNDRAEAENRLSDIAEAAIQDSGVAVEYLTHVGSIFDDIGNIARELEARLILMGTHGMKGWQFLTGSNALRVIKDSTTPFIVVQERKIEEGGYDVIVLPIDLSKEEKQKLKGAVEIAKFFGSMVHIVSPIHNDEFLRNQQQRNMHYAETFLEEEGVKHESHILEDSGSFDQEVVAFAEKVNADLISIINHEDAVGALFGSSFEQQLITNKSEIPVMVINPTAITTLGGVIGT